MFSRNGPLIKLFKIIDLILLNPFLRLKPSASNFHILIAHSLVFFTKYQ